MNVDASSAMPDADALLELELQVARRADELARDQPKRAGLNLHCWLIAEAEVFRHHRGMLASGAGNPPAPPPLDSAA